MTPVMKKYWVSVQSADYIFFLIIFLQTVALWDLRNLKLKLHSFESHKDEIFQVRLGAVGVSNKRKESLAAVVH